MSLGFAVQFAAHQLERLRDRDQRFHARRRLQRLQFAAPAAAAHRADHGALGAADDVGLEAALLDALDHVLDLFFGRVRLMLTIMAVSPLQNSRAN